MRVQSPSSINTYKQCPRKYYYQYIMNIAPKPSIHLLRGSIVHEILEDFFRPGEDILKDHRSFFQKRIIMDMSHRWGDKEEELRLLCKDPERLEYLKKETGMMLINWVNDFINRFEKQLKKGKDLNSAFLAITPITEQEFISEELSVRGFIDAIEMVDGKIKIVDYKTSNSSAISEGYKLQLAIYSLLYREKHKRIPDSAALYFLKEGEKEIAVDDKLIDFALREVKQIHEKTRTDKIEDYPKNATPLCKWRTGQCDYYDVCYKDENREF